MLPSSTHTCSPHEFLGDKLHIRQLSIDVKFQHFLHIYVAYENGLGLHKLADTDWTPRETSRSLYWIAPHVRSRDLTLYTLARNVSDTARIRWSVWAFNVLQWCSSVQYVGLLLLLHTKEFCAIWELFMLMKLDFMFSVIFQAVHEYTLTITPTKHIFTENIVSFYLVILHQILNLMILLWRLTPRQTILEILLFNRRISLHQP